MNHTRFHPGIGLAFLALSAFAQTACSSGGGACDPSVPSDCPADEGFAQFCSVFDGNNCVNVCQGAQLTGGCELDRHCSLPLTCDNDRVSVSTCECVAACSAVGAAPGSVPEGGSCGVQTDCASGLRCDNARVGLASCICVAEDTGKIPGCSEASPPDGPGSVAPGGPCDEDADCQANSCRDPADNPSEGCTCRNLDGGGGCGRCVGVNTGPDNDPNFSISCEPSAEDQFACDCLTDSGETLTGFLSSDECFF